MQLTKATAAAAAAAAAAASLLLKGVLQAHLCLLQLRQCQAVATILSQLLGP
jgi:hypothetical protein